MRIAYLLTDSGIPFFGTKGASVHARSITRAINELGHQVTCYAARIGNSAVPRCGLPVHEIGLDPFLIDMARDLAGNIDPTPDQRTFTVDVTPVTITGHVPDGVLSNEVCDVELTFSEDLADLGVGDSLEDQLVTVSPIWSKAKPEDLQWKMGGRWYRTKSGPPLQLAPGAIRVLCIA